MPRQHDPQLVSLIVDVARLAKGWMRSSNVPAPGVVSHVRLATLAFVQEHDRPTMKDLAERLCIAAPSATLLAASLVRHGLLRRVKAVDDRRTVCLTLTPKGSKALTQGTLEMRKRIGVVISHFTAQERVQLKKMLGRLIRSYRPSKTN